MQVQKIGKYKYEIKLNNRLEIASYCSIIERELKNQVESYLNKWSRFQKQKIKKRKPNLKNHVESFHDRFEAPKLVEKLEAKLQKKIGEEVVIELFKF